MKWTATTATTTTTTAASSTTAPTTCTDIPGWKDAEGDTCDSIVQNENCHAAADYSVDGVDAKQACCGCKDAPTFAPACNITEHDALAVDVNACNENLAC